MKMHKPQKGFTIVELMVVVTVVGVMAAMGIAAVNQQRQRDRAQDAVRLAKVENLAMAVESYFASEGVYPDIDGDTPDLSDPVLQKFVSDWSDEIIYGLETDGSNFSVYALQSDDNYVKYRSSTGTTEGCYPDQIDVVTYCAKTDTYVPENTLMKIEVTPESYTLELGGTGIQLSAQAIYSNNDKIDITEEVEWVYQHTGTAVVSVSGSGFVNPLAVGSAQVTAEYNTETESFSDYSDISVVQPPPELQSIVVSAMTGTDINVGEVAEFTATANFTDGSSQDVTLSSDTSWLILSGDTVVSNLSQGRFQGIAGGSATIQANYYAKTDTGTIQVTDTTPPPTATLQSVTVEPPSVSVKIGESKPLLAKANYSDGSVTDITTNPDTQWVEATGAQNINLTVGSQVTVQGVIYGFASVTASYQGKTGTSNITVSPIDTGGGTGECTTDEDCSDYTCNRNRCPYCNTFTGRCACTFCMQ